MDEWHDFFLAAAGAAAVLAGLVFVGLSINLDQIMSNPTLGLTGSRLGSSGVVDGRTHSDLLTVGAGPGDGASWSRSAGSGNR